MSIPVWTECVLVGLYSVIIFIVIDCFFSFVKRRNFPHNREEYGGTILFLTGFFKHFMGWIFSLQSLYCNYGNACVRTTGDDKIYWADETFIIPESILEGVLYVTVGWLLFSLSFPLGINKLFWWKWTILFVSGVIIHFLAEWMGIHGLYCKYKCI